MWRLFRPTFADFHPVDVLPPLGVLDQIKHATCVAKLIHVLTLLRILQQTSATLAE